MDKPLHQKSTFLLSIVVEFCVTFLRYMDKADLGTWVSITLAVLGIYTGKELYVKRRNGNSKMQNVVVRGVGEDSEVIK